MKGYLYWVGPGACLLGLVLIKLIDWEDAVQCGVHHPLAAYMRMGTSSLRKEHIHIHFTLRLTIVVTGCIELQVITSLQ